MLKLSGTCLISKNQKTQQPDLEFATATTGNPLVKGRFYWQDSGVDREGKKTSSDIKFVAYGDAVDFIKNNVTKILDLKDCGIKKNSWKNKNGIWQNLYEVIIFNRHNISVYEKKDKAQPAKSFHETENNFDDIPY